MIENDAISAEMYQQRLDELLSIGQVEADVAAAAGLSDAGRYVADTCSKMDTGLITDGGEAFDEADRRVRAAGGQVNDRGGGGGKAENVEKVRK